MIPERDEPIPALAAQISLPKDCRMFGVQNITCR